MKTYPWWVYLLIEIDRIIQDCWFGGYHETISSHLGKLARDNKLTWRKPLQMLIYICLEKIDPGHCERSIEE